MRIELINNNNILKVIDNINIATITYSNNYHP